MYPTTDWTNRAERTSATNPQGIVGKTLSPSPPSFLQALKTTVKGPANEQTLNGFSASPNSVSKLGKKSKRSLWTLKPSILQLKFRGLEG